MDMKNPLLLLAITIGTAFTAQSALIILVPELSYNTSSASSFIIVPTPPCPTCPSPEYDNRVDTDRITEVPTRGDTSAVTRVGGVPSGAVTASSSTSYRVTETEASGSWQGMLVWPGTNNVVGNEFSFGFVPTMDLRYELEGTYKNFPPNTLEGTFGTLLFSESRIAVNQVAHIPVGPFDPPLADPYTFSFSGILEAGETWRFVQSSVVGRITGNDVLVDVPGSWSLRLRPAVPDAGSTLILLATALGGLFLIKRNVASKRTPATEATKTSAHTPPGITLRNPTPPRQPV